MSDAFELEICQGKYRYRYEAGKQEVWRNGYIWQTLNGKLIGDKFVFSLAVELDEALKECGELRAKIEAMEKQAPVEVVGLYNFMCAAFVPMTPQQEQIAVQLELAKRAMLAAAPEAKQ